MSVENSKVIDVVNIDLNGDVIFTISDHLEWKDDNEHILLLQEKINAYLSAIESEDLYKQYPDAKGRHAIISVVAKYTPNEDGEIFIQRVKDALADEGYGFTFFVGTSKIP